MKTFAIAAILCASTVLYSEAGYPHKYSNPTDGEFPILGWSAIRGVENQIPERYREMRECGFNLAFPLVDSLSEVKLALDASTGSGIKIIAGSSEFADNPEATVKAIGSHPQLAGYFFKDEPNCGHYPELAAQINRVRKLDDTKLLYLNLFPTYAPEQLTGTSDYDEYVKRYIDELGTGFLSYDHYSITADSLGNTSISSDYYKNLEIISRHARNSGIPFWAFALSTAHYSFPAATREHLRLQMFSNLAYGAQGIQYFTYWQFVGLGDSKDVPMTNAGERGTSWWLVRDLNREIQALAPIFLGAEVVSIAHTGDSIPDGTTRLSDLPTPFKSLSSSGGEGLLISHFRNCSTNYLMIVNRDLHNRQSVDIISSGDVDFIVAADEPIPASAVSPKMWLAPGDYLLYRWE